MSFGSLVSVAFTFAIVLGVMGLALRLVRKYAMGGATQSGFSGMRVVHRIALSQRQGIAVVRLGTRVLAVSMGEGGVHLITELAPDEIPMPEPVELTSPIPIINLPESATRFMTMMRDAVRKQTTS